MVGSLVIFLFQHGFSVFVALFFVCFNKKKNKIRFVTYTHSHNDYLLCILYMAQNDSSSLNVAQASQKVRQPCSK